MVLYITLRNTRSILMPYTIQRNTGDVVSVMSYTVQRNVGDSDMIYVLYKEIF